MGDVEVESDAKNEERRREKKLNKLASHVSAGYHTRVTLPTVPFSEVLKQIETESSSDSRRE